MSEAQIETLRRLPRAALWAVAARLKTLSLSITPAVAGTWIGATDGAWDLDVFLSVLISAAAIQIGTNLWNDAADAAHGVDTQERLGPPRLTALGLLEGSAVRKAAVAAFLIAAASGMNLVLAGGIPILIIGILSLLMGYLYSMGPYPLSMTPFGEVLVILFFGVIAVAGAAYLQAGAFDIRAVGFGAVLGLPAAAVLLINNHRDRRTDLKAGRQTLAILLGETGSRGLYSALLTGTVTGVLWFQAPLCIAAWLPLASLGVFALALAWQVWRTPISPTLNRILPQTALFQAAVTAIWIALPSFCRT